MKQELLKKLKDTGFPKHECSYLVKGEIICGMCEQGMSPSLSELIKACGDRFAMIGREENYWYARADEACNECSSTQPSGEGDTPEEAVANLWLSLNKK